MNRDIIVIGASAGGVEVVLNLVEALPADLPASVFVVVHAQPDRKSLLPQLMNQRGPLPAGHPLHGDPIQPGHIYVAPPDNQLYVRPTTMEIVRGPQENGHRPSVDALFRTAAVAHGPRVIGVVLSGYQDCGTAGMMSVKAHGGISVVQEPSSAFAAEMPRSVMANVPVDHVAPPAALGELLAELVRQPVTASPRPGGDAPDVERAAARMRSDIVCPLCQGTLTEAHAGTFQHFRCHVGHAFSLESLVAEQSESLERALWSAVRALEESAALSQRLGARETSDLERRFAERARTHVTQADLIRHLLLLGRPLSPQDAPKP